MTNESYGKIWCLDLCLPMAPFNLLDENDMKKCFNRVNLRQMYCSEDISEGDNIDHRLYLMQYIEAYQFIKLYDQEGPKIKLHCWNIF